MAVLLLPAYRRRIAIAFSWRARRSRSGGCRSSWRSAWCLCLSGRRLLDLMLVLLLKLLIFRGHRVVQVEARKDLVRIMDQLLVILPKLLPLAGRAVNIV